jgi:hypothetical protein
MEGKLAGGLEKVAGWVAMQFEPGYETCYSTVGHETRKGKSTP